jgi:hypothetical protein
MNVREGMRRLSILLGACGGILGVSISYGDAKATWESHAASRKFESLMASPTMQKVAKAAREYQNGPWVKYRSNGWSGQVTYDPNGTVRETAVPDFDQSKAEQLMADLSQLSDEQLGVYRDLLAKKQGPAVAGKDRKPRAKSKLGGITIDEDTNSGKSQPWEKAAKNEDWKIWRRDTEAPATLPREFFDKPGAMLVSVGLDGIRQVGVDKAGLVFSIEASTGAWANRTEAPALKAYVIPLLYPILGFLLPWGGIQILTWVGSGFAEPRR